MALRWWGMGSSTLLGPEGSAGPRSRVGEPLLGCLRLRVGVVLVASGPPFVPHVRVLWSPLVGVVGVGVGGVGGVVV
jgi:hypothetical protein